MEEIKLLPHSYGDHLKITAKQINKLNKPEYIKKANYHLEQAVKYIKRVKEIEK